MIILEMMKIIKKDNLFYNKIIIIIIMNNNIIINYYLYFNIITINFLLNHKKKTIYIHIIKYYLYLYLFFSYCQIHICFILFSIFITFKTLNNSKFFQIS